MDAAVLIRDLNHAHLDGDVVDRDHATYDRLRRTWNAMADRRPAVIVRARSVADVEKVVAAAADHDALLAVRGGGHSIPGLSTCDGGIVLDLSLMNAVAVDRSASRAEVLGGALLGDLDRAGAPAGLVVPAGVVSHTGVAGLTLGGGMGWLSRRLGLTIDNLLAVDIVTADGRSRHVSADAEPDLFWAIRGGGGNFGVVTRFTFRMHPLGQVLVGSWVYPVAEAGAVLRRYRDLAANAPRELTTGVVFTSADLLITALWSGTPYPAETAVAPFGALGRPKSASLGVMTFLELQRRSDDRMAWNRRYYAKGGYLKEVDDHAVDHMVDCIASAPAPDAEVYLLQLGGAISDIADDATPYTGRAAGYYWIVESGWDDKADDERVIAWSRMAAGRLAGISMRGNYVNEQGDFGKEIALAAYGERKYRRLADLKSRYDPTNLFRLNQNIEPKP
ncbi:MAG TPA: FAD-binding oxidoreductase [Geminicoccaceae bacterium]|nr:FAD-binding oxidoreductase [Geminicoccaceae bacterium]